MTSHVYISVYVYKQNKSSENQTAKQKTHYVIS